MTYKIVYTKSATLNESGTDECDGSATRLVMEVTAVEDFADLGIFVYMIDPVTLQNVYSHVATPCDLAAYNYLTAGGKAYVRLAELDKVYGSAELATTGLASIEASMTDLVQAMTDLDTLGPTVTATISA